ncbi:hypothetical protein 035JT001_82 [Bacillus phage 035JT001]|nr:hypothetical protein 035JT001_82 [Bacillus phage 035JT001]
MTEREIIEQETTFIIERMKEKTGKEYSREEIELIMDCKDEQMEEQIEEFEEAAKGMNNHIIDVLAMEGIYLTHEVFKRIDDLRFKYLQDKGYIPEDWEDE